ncbi:MAG: Sec-independent protein translocase protein TatB [Actinomycetota bacterium]
MGNIGFPEMMVIAVVALLVFGPRRLPDMARQAGKALREFKKVTGDLTEDLKAGLDDPAFHDSAADDPAFHPWPVPETKALPIESESVTTKLGATEPADVAVNQQDPQMADPDIREYPPGKEP